MLLRTSCDPFDAGPECRPFRQIGIFHPAVYITTGIVDTGAELLPQKQIPDPVGLEALCERLSIELGIVAAVWRRADIGH